MSGRPDEFGMRVAHLVLSQPTAFELVHEMPTSETVVDHTGPTQRSLPERHDGRGYPGSTQR